MTVEVRAVPRSSRPGIDGWQAGALKVRIKSAPVDGKANKELIATLADAFGIAKAAVSIASGQTSKTKRVELAGVTEEALVKVAGLR